MARREARLHRHDLIAHKAIEALEHALVEPSAAELLRAGEQHRARIGAGEGDAQIDKLVGMGEGRWSVDDLSSR